MQGCHCLVVQFDLLTSGAWFCTKIDPYWQLRFATWWLRWTLEWLITCAYVNSINELHITVQCSSTCSCIQSTNKHCCYYSVVHAKLSFIVARLAFSRLDVISCNFTQDLQRSPTAFEERRSPTNCFWRAAISNCFLRPTISNCFRRPAVSDLLWKTSNLQLFLKTNNI